jgi:MFS transporter, CP family, cyanate transporter
MLDPLRKDLHLSAVQAAVLTAVPVFCFGALAPAGPWLSRRVGLRPAVGVLCATLVAGLVLPALATRMRRQHALVVLAVVLTGAGLLAILVAPTAAAVLWVVILGLGQGAAFALALTLLVVRTRSHAATAPLSAMAQSVGYLITGLGPLAVGALHAATGGWTAGLVVLLALLVPETIAGLRAAATRRRRSADRRDRS